MWKKSKVVQTWKDEDLREQAAETGEALVPSPVGMVELSDEDLEFVVGGAVAPDQTGTGSSTCYCIKTSTASSSGGTCYCTCPSESPSEPVLV
jgi:mersacidin/lichenicidin family type 2 lantibiotic